MVVQARHPHRDAFDLGPVVGKQGQRALGNDALRHDAHGRPAREEVREERVRALDGLRGESVACRAQEDGRRRCEIVQPREVERRRPGHSTQARSDCREWTVEAPEAAARREVDDMVCTEARLERNRDRRPRLAVATCLGCGVKGCSRHACSPPRSVLPSRRCPRPLGRPGDGRPAHRRRRTPGRASP